MKNININDSIIKYEVHGKEIFVWNKELSNADRLQTHKALKVIYGKDTSIYLPQINMIDKLSIRFNTNI